MPKCKLDFNYCYGVHKIQVIGLHSLTYLRVRNKSRWAVEYRYWHSDTGSLQVREWRVEGV